MSLSGTAKYSIVGYAEDKAFFSLLATAYGELPLELYRFTHRLPAKGHWILGHWGNTDILVGNMISELLSLDSAVMRRCLKCMGTCRISCTTKQGQAKASFELVVRIYQLGLVLHQGGLQKISWLHTMLVAAFPLYSR